MRKKTPSIFSLPLLLLPLLPLGLGGCADVQARFIKRGIQTTVKEYFEGGVWRLDSLGGGVHSYRMGFDRNLIVETAEGLVIVDPYNEVAAKRLAAVLRERWPGRPVSHLIYSHYHLDHVRGGAVLQPREVIAHARSEWYWSQVERGDVLAPTRTIEGDVTLQVGGVEIQLLHLGKSHTDTNYAVFLPRQKALYLADTIFVRALPPVGGPDVYRPGVRAALARLSALDFQSFVPSHLDTGTKADFLATRDLYLETHRLVARHASEGRTLTDDGPRFNAAFDSVYDALEPRYASWHGGRPALLLFIQQAFVGEFLGF
jgi:glyoxylase-like metal-dependent hydrolase (beta-lactamase superfamily II)